MDIWVDRVARDVVTSFSVGEKKSWASVESEVAVVEGVWRR